MSDPIDEYTLEVIRIIKASDDVEFCGRMLRKNVLRSFANVAAEEREACAKIADEAAKPWVAVHSGEALHPSDLAERIAAAIRSRGDYTKRSQAIDDIAAIDREIGIPD